MQTKISKEQAEELIQKLLHIIDADVKQYFEYKVKKMQASWWRKLFGAKSISRERAVKKLAKSWRFQGSEKDLLFYMKHRLFGEELEWIVNTRKVLSYAKDDVALSDEDMKYLSVVM